jgi:hypothetical protein
MTQVIRPLLPHKRQRQKKITKKTPNYPIFFFKKKQVTIKTITKYGIKIK